MVIAITKRKKSSETKVSKWRKALSRTHAIGEVHFISIYELWRKELWDITDFGKQTKWQPESRAFGIKYG